MRYRLSATLHEKTRMITLAVRVADKGCNSKVVIHKQLPDGCKSAE
jgi:hypothetical protein